MMADVRALGLFHERVKGLLGSLLEVLLSEITEAYRESFPPHTCKHCEKCSRNNPPESNKGFRDRRVRAGSPQSPSIIHSQCSDGVSPLQMVAGGGQEVMDAALSHSITPKNPSPPPLQVTPSEQKEIQSATVAEKVIQTTLTVSNSEIKRFPEISDMLIREEEFCLGRLQTADQQQSLDTNEAKPAQDIKPESEETAVTVEDVILVILKDHKEEEIRHLEESSVDDTEAESLVQSEARVKPEEIEACEIGESAQTRSPDAQQEVSCFRGSECGDPVHSQQPSCSLLEGGQKESSELRRRLRRCSVQLQTVQILKTPSSQSRPFHVCSFCSKIFIYRKTLRRHRCLHTGERPHHCSLCPKAFILRKTLRKHKRTHFKRPYSCTQCEQRFKHWKKLCIHWRSHVGEGPFVCSHCGKCCRTLKSLDRHLAYVNHD